MVFRRKGSILLLGIVALAIFVTALSLSNPYDSPLKLVVRLCALYGYLALSIATIMTPFLKEIMKVFGKPFIKLHHIFAILGITFATLHPVAFAIQTMNATVFLPSFRSWYAFWALAGRPALIMIYVGVVAALLRNTIRKYWRPIHLLMYVVLLFGIIHGNLIGTDFQNVVIRTIINFLFMASIAAFLLKRFQRYRMKLRAHTKW